MGEKHIRWWNIQWQTKITQQHFLQKVSSSPNHIGIFGSEKLYGNKDWLIVNIMQLSLKNLNINWESYRYSFEIMPKWGCNEISLFIKQSCLTSRKYWNLKSNIIEIVCHIYLPLPSPREASYYFILLYSIPWKLFLRLFHFFWKMSCTVINWLMRCQNLKKCP